MITVIFKEIPVIIKNIFTGIFERDLKSLATDSLGIKGVEPSGS